MENASKALIIAGAILLSILIIGIGIFIFNQANEVIDGSMSGMTRQELDAFNNEFLMYQGEQSGANVKALLSKVSANLGTNQEKTDRLPVVMFYKQDPSSKAIKTTSETAGKNPGGIGLTDTTSDYAKDISRATSAVISKNTYYVQFRTGQNGVVLGIGITDVTGKSATELETQISAVNTALDSIVEKADTGL